jgi:hypothetical protein
MKKCLHSGRELIPVNLVKHDADELDDAWSV